MTSLAKPVFNLCYCNFNYTCSNGCGQCNDCKVILNAVEPYLNEIELEFFKKFMIKMFVLTYICSEDHIERLTKNGYNVLLDAWDLLDKFSFL